MTVEGLISFSASPTAANIHTGIMAAIIVFALIGFGYCFAKKIEIF